MGWRERRGRRRSGREGESEKVRGQLRRLEEEETAEKSRPRVPRHEDSANPPRPEEQGRVRDFQFRDMELTVLESPK
jgi:hypothetical protein